MFTDTRIGLFTIVPTTQYVWVDTTATFECATNNTQGYELVFSIPNVAEDISSDTLPGGEQKLTATFTATSDFNGTSVICRAVDGDFNVIDSTEVVQVLVQGKL